MQYGNSAVGTNPLEDLLAWFDGIDKKWTLATTLEIMQNTVASKHSIIEAFIVSTLKKILDLISHCVDTTWQTIVACTIIHHSPPQIVMTRNHETI